MDERKNIFLRLDINFWDLSQELFEGLENKMRNDFFNSGKKSLRGLVQLSENQLLKIDKKLTEGSGLAGGCEGTFLERTLIQSIWLFSSAARMRSSLALLISKLCLQGGIFVLSTHSLWYFKLHFWHTRAAGGLSIFQRDLLHPSKSQCVGER